MHYRAVHLKWDSSQFGPELEFGVGVSEDLVASSHFCNLVDLRLPQQTGSCVKSE